MQKLPRTLGFKTTLLLVVGSVIGSAIFMRPVEIVQLLGSPALVFLAWICGGVFTLLMVMVLAELAAMMPEEGGQYAIMRNVYGEFWAYLFGWACFAVINCAGSAGIAFIFSQYLEYFIPLPSFSSEVEKSFSLTMPMVGTVFPLEHFGVKMVSIFIVSLFTYVSYRSTKFGGLLNSIFTFAKLAAIFILIGGFVAGKVGSMENLVTSSSSIAPAGMALLIAFVAALNGTLLAYDGTSNMLNVAGEIKEPGKNIPRALISGIFICILVYLLTNAGLMYVLGLDAMAGSALVASDAAERSFGVIGGGMVAFFICISVLGTTIANILTPPRLTFAMARDGVFLSAAGKIHPRFNTPGNALLIHWVFMIPLILTGSFYMLTDMYIFILWFFNLFFIAGIFILRKRMPDEDRPYKVWGYPWMPLLVFAGNSIFLLLVVYKDVTAYLEGQSILMNSVASIVMTAAGIPLYYFFKWRKIRD
ncbi:MAG TPA: amino acid permease [Chitinophagaceae bacterium]|nr:amino acid permease [Chitinophagaceae bacterium]